MYKKSSLYTILLVLIQISNSITTSYAMNPPKPPQWITDIINDVATTTQTRASGIGIHYENNTYNNITDPVERATLIAARDRRNRQREGWAETERQFTTGIANTAIGFLNTGIEKGKIKAQGEADAQKWKMAIGETFKQFGDPEFLKKFVLFLTASGLGIAGTYYGTKLLYAYLEANMGKPTLVRETSKTTFWGNFITFFGFGTEFQAPEKLTDMVFSTTQSERLSTLVSDLKEIKTRSLPFKNMVFYGDPGTGKTAFVKALAKESDMDYAIMTGGDFAQFKKDGQDVVELHKIFDWAEAGNGVILFIDEADACLKNISEFLNAFIARTGTSSTKFMLILATNYVESLDPRVRDRMKVAIKFDLPSTDERLIMLQKKLEKNIINFQRTFYNADNVEISETLQLDQTVTNEYLQSVAEKTAGFSGRHIQQVAEDIQLRGFLNNCLVTCNIIDDVIAEKLAQVLKDKDINKQQTINVK